MINYLRYDIKNDKISRYIKNKIIINFIFI